MRVVLTILCVLLSFCCGVFAEKDFRISEVAITHVRGNCCACPCCGQCDCCLGCPGNARHDGKCTCVPGQCNCCAKCVGHK
jgi:hypothetical protein